MIHRDWFKHHVEIMMQALAAILGLKAKGATQAASEACKAALQKAFGMDGKLALVLPLDELMSLGCRGQSPSPEFLAAAAKLFQEWAGLLETQGRPAEAAAAAARAQALLQIKEKP